MTLTNPVYKQKKGLKYWINRVNYLPVVREIKIIGTVDLNPYTIITIIVKLL